MRLFDNGQNSVILFEATLSVYKEKSIRHYVQYSKSLSYTQMPGHFDRQSLILSSRVEACLSLPASNSIRNMQVGPSKRKGFLVKLT